MAVLSSTSRRMKKSQSNVEKIQNFRVTGGWLCGDAELPGWKMSGAYVGVAKDPRGVARNASTARSKQLVQPKVLPQLQEEQGYPPLPRLMGEKEKPGSCILSSQLTIQGCQRGTAEGEPLGDCQILRTK